MAKLGSVYAKAAFELASEKGSAEEFARQLRTFWEACQSNRALSAALTGLTVDTRARKAILADIMKALEVTGVPAKLLNLLAERGRMAYVPEVIEQLEALIEASQGVLQGQVKSAVELSADELNVLGAALAKRVGAKVRLTQMVDSSLLGGVVATVGGKTFDASLRTQIERFRNELI